MLITVMDLVRVEACDIEQRLDDLAAHKGKEVGKLKLSDGLRPSQWVVVKKAGNPSLYSASFNDIAYIFESRDSFGWDLSEYLKAFCDLLPKKMIQELLKLEWDDSINKRFLKGALSYAKRGADFNDFIDTKLGEEIYQYWKNDKTRHIADFLTNDSLSLEGFVSLLARLGFDNPRIRATVSDVFVATEKSLREVSNGS
jgi:hypothetical protein